MFIKYLKGFRHVQVYFICCLVDDLSVAAAETGQLENTTVAARNMPVIVKNEVLSPGLCRLYFEDGGKQDISCASADGEKS